MPKHRHVDPPFITGKKCFACGGEIPLCHPLTRYCSVKCQNFVRYAVQLTTARKLQAMSNKVKMDSGCVDCGYRLHPSALQFDHIASRGKKIKVVGKFTDPIKMRAEMAKCDVRCANCRFIKTMERRMMKRALTPEQETRIRDIVERLVAFGNLKSRA